MKTAHAALGEAIGAGETPVRYARAELAAAVRDLADAIADYCLQLAGQVDRDDPESVQIFRAAMMPIDRFRADHASGGADEEDEDEPVVTPVALTPGPTPSPVVLPSPFVTTDVE